jgi:hypothetical protein
MPLQNRVLPTGEIVADPARGMFTGNRGCLHDDQRQLGRARWKGRAWIICALDYKGWRRVVMTPRTWTELFFLDEAVALAAGHRPCALCRRAAFLAFQAGSGGLKAPQMDAVLHGARLEGRGQRRHQAPLEGLPDGVFVDHGGPHLVRGAGLWPYAPAGYGAPVARFEGEVTVLTPAPTVAVLRAGYRPVMA